MMKYVDSISMDASLIKTSLKNAIYMLKPQIQFKNPVMFVTYVGAILTTIVVVIDAVNRSFSFFEFQLAFWLFGTVIFANFSQAIAEARGRAHVASLGKTKIDAYARQIRHGIEIATPSAELKKDDFIVCEAGDTIAADGDVVAGIAMVDESAITGESAPVIRESGGDRCAVTAGTKVLSDKITIKVTSESGNSFLDRMVGLVEAANRQKTPSEIALKTILSGLTIIFLLMIISLKFFSDYTARATNQDFSKIITVPVLISLLVCLIPTTISALLNAIGIAGMDRLIRRNVVAKSSLSVEAAGGIDMLILDKTGTITIGNRVATEFIAAPHSDLQTFAEIAQLSSLSDDTPEGRSVVVLAKAQFGLRAETLELSSSVFFPFSAHTRMSGVDYKDADGKVVRSIRKGSADVMKKFIEELGGVYPEKVHEIVKAIAKKGATPLVVSDNQNIVGVIQLKDMIKPGIKERFTEMRKMGIHTLMVTGDNPMTAAAIAAEAGVEDYIADATPEMKLERIRQEQKEGRVVAMTGDGSNDAPALAQSDVGVAMNTGTQASREAGNMVDLDSNPTKLIDIVQIGKQLLMTRGALTIFSIANDIAKYVAIIPAIFGTFYVIEAHSEGPLSILNIMMLRSPQSAILSAVIFNALIIAALVPLALRGVKCDFKSSYNLLRRNIITYGLGGIIAPFIAIKVIDLLINFLSLV